MNDSPLENRLKSASRILDIHLDHIYNEDLNVSADMLTMDLEYVNDVLKDVLEEIGDA